MNYLKPINGNCIIEFDKVYEDEIAGLIVSSEFSQEQFQRCIGTVIDVCDSKTLTRDFETVPNTIKPGQRVVMDYMAAQNALGSGRTNTKKNKIISSSPLRAVVSAAWIYAYGEGNGQLNAAGGFVLARKTREEQHIPGFEVISTEDHSDQRIFEVVSVGAPTIHTIEPGVVLGQNLKPGDHIIFDWNFHIPLQYEAFAEDDQLIVIPQTKVALYRH
jgi:co-chaperonin GroES (HSP10)